MTAIAADLAALLAKANRPGDFFTSGTTELLAPSWHLLRTGRRASQVSCKCEHCTSLSKFLADPREHTWVLRAVEHDRGHVEETIRTSNVDVDTKTDRKGRPYSWVCTKNQASYERGAVQRKQDLQDITQMGG